MKEPTLVAVVCARFQHCYTVDRCPAVRNHEPPSTTTRSGRDDLRRPWRSVMPHRPGDAFQARSGQLPRCARGAPEHHARRDRPAGLRLLVETFSKERLIRLQRPLRWADFPRDRHRLVEVRCGRRTRALQRIRARTQRRRPPV